MGYLDGLEADGPFHPEVSRIGGAGMAENLPLLVLDDLRLSCGTPLRVNVPVALVISIDHFQVHYVVQVTLKALHTHQQGWEESPERKQMKQMKKMRIKNSYILSTELNYKQRGK